jgi:adenylate kinase
MRIILLGGPGSGKGTQGKKLALQLNVPRISTGEVLRAAVDAGTELGCKAQPVMAAGGLVADEIVDAIVEQCLSQPDTAAGFILDGFPRNLAQAKALDAMLPRLHLPPIDLALDLEVESEELVQRLLLRARQEHRADDREEVIRERIRVYGKQTRPLLDYYAAQKRLVTVLGSGQIDEVFGRVLAAVMRPPQS